MIKFFHRLAACLMACLIISDPSTALALSNTSTPFRCRVTPGAIFQEQALVAGMTDFLRSLASSVKIKQSQWAHRIIQAPRDEVAKVRQVDFAEQHDNQTDSDLQWRKRGIRFIFGAIRNVPLVIHRGWLLGAGFAGLAVPAGLLDWFKARLDNPSNIWAHRFWNVWAPASLALKRKSILPDMLPGEVALSKKGLVNYFEASGPLANKIALHLPDVNGPEAAITVEGIKINKRLNISREVWTIAQTDIPKLGAWMNWKRAWPQVSASKEDLVAVAIKAMQTLIPANTGTTVKALQAALPVLDGPEEETTFAGVQFFKRKAKIHLVWAVRKKDVLRAAAAVGWKASNVEPMGPDEIPISQQGVSPYYRGNSGDLSNLLQRRLPGLDSPNIEVRLDGIQFTKRAQRKGKLIWTLNRRDIQAVAVFMGWQMKSQQLELPHSDDISVTTHGMVTHFVGDALQRAQELNNRLPPLSGPETESELQGILFTKRRTGKHYLWTFPASKVEEVSKAMGWKLRTDYEVPLLEDDEISVTQRAFQPILEGRGQDYSVELLAHLPNVEGSVNSAEFKGIPFARRRSGSQFVWAFADGLMDDLAALMGWRLRREIPLPPLAQDEVAVIAKGLARIYRPDKGMAAALRERLPDLHDPETEVQIGEIRFFKRKSGVHDVFAFSLADAKAVGAMMEWPLREAAEMMIAELGLEEVVALLGSDPLRLQQYLQLYHPELSPEDIQGIATVGGMAGLNWGTPEKDEPHKDFKRTLQPPTVETPDIQDGKTDSHAVRIVGRVTPGIPMVQVFGAYTRRIRANKLGYFEARLPLPRTGQLNEFYLYAVDEDSEECSDPIEFAVEQTSPKEDTEEIFRKLIALREDLLEGIRKNPARYHFMLRTLEQSLLRYFTQNEGAGFVRLRERIEQEKSIGLRSMLEAIEAKFKDIADMPLNLQEGMHLYFFQKYTAYETLALLQEGAEGVIIANEQGLGKTVTALVVANGREALIITPNAVVSTWAEEEEKFVKVPRIELLEGTYKQREQTLKAVGRPQVVINVEFTQGMTRERAALLSNLPGRTGKIREMLIVDEADFLGRLASQQSKGTRQLKARFRLLLTATPFRTTSQIGTLLGFLFPEDKRFRSTRAFARAFPTTDRQSLDALFLLMQKYTIRIRKRDVFEEYDPALSLDQQKDMLPAKKEFSPDESGRFDLSKEQMESIHELFTHYEQWCEKHAQWIERAGQATDEDRKYKRFKEGFFPKLQALRQITNSPAYFGRPDVESPKHKKMDQIVDKEMNDAALPGSKILIFCKYQAQVEEYIKRYASYGAVAYYGGLRKNADGYKVDDLGSLEYYAVDDYQNPILVNGRPVKSNARLGRPIRALDYSRLVFQNDPQCRMIVATYDSGAVGVTLTGANAVIYDDMAPSYRDQYQAGDRAHRIDNSRKKYEVRYYWLQARYPQAFLDTLPPEDLHTYFETGTFDQVQYENLRGQAWVFHRIMDGVGSESELKVMHQRFLKERMPFLFKARRDAQETEEATQEDSPPWDESTTKNDGAPEGFLAVWKPLIPWLQKRGWSDRRIVGVLGGAEEMLFSGILVSVGSLLLTHLFGISLSHAIEIASLVSGILFPLVHWKERYRLVGGQLTLAPPDEKKRDLLVLAVLGAVVRLAYALPLAHLPLGQWNVLAALPLAVLGHALYNAWIAPKLNLSLAMVDKTSTDPKPDKPLLEAGQRPSLEDLRHKIYAVHVTQWLPKRGLVKTASNRVLRSVAMLDESPSFHPTLHFSFGEMVQVHANGDWEESKYAVLTPLGTLEPQLVNLNAYDTFIVGDFHLAPESILVMPEKASATDIPPDVTLVRYRKSEGLRRAVDRALQQAGGWPLRMLPMRGDFSSPAYFEGRNINTPDFFAELLAAHPGLSFGTHVLSETGPAYLLGQIGIFLDDLLAAYQPLGPPPTTSTLRVMHAVFRYQLDQLQKSALLSQLPAPAIAQLQGEILKARRWLNFVETDIHLREIRHRTLSRADADILEGARNLRVNPEALARFVASRLSRLPRVDPAKDEPANLFLLSRAFESAPAAEFAGFLHDHPEAVANMNPSAIRLLYATQRWCLIGPERAASEGLPQWLNDSVQDLLRPDNTFERIDFIAQIYDYLYADSSHLPQALSLLQQPAVHKYAARRLHLRFSKNEPTTLSEVLKKHPRTKAFFEATAPPVTPELRELIKMTHWPEAADEWNQLHATMPRSFVEAQERIAQIDNAEDFIGGAKTRFTTSIHTLGKDDWGALIEGDATPRQAWAKLGLGRQYRKLYPSDDLFWKSEKSSVDIYRDLMMLKESKPQAGRQGLLMLWRPIIARLQDRGWSDTRIVGTLGGAEEFLFSGVLVSLGTLLLTHVFGISLGHALEITSFISGILFPLMHWKERYRLVGGQLTLAPANEKKKDMLVLAILGAVLRLAYALPLAHLPFGHWNTLIALPLAFLGHAGYNAWIAPNLGLALGVKVTKPSAPPVSRSEIAWSIESVRELFSGNPGVISAIVNKELRSAKPEENEIIVRGVPFARRWFHDRLVWAFKRSSLDRLAEAFQLLSRAALTLEDDDIVVSQRSLPAVFIGDYSSLLPTLIKQLPPAKGPQQQHQVGKVIFRKRMQQVHLVWTFKKADVPILSAMFGWSVRESAAIPKIRPGEVPVSTNGLLPHFEGVDLSNALNAKLPSLTGDAMQHTLNGIQFNKRFAGPKRVWSFSQEAIPLVADLMGWRLRGREPLERPHDDEIKVTAQGNFTRLFVGDGTVLFLQLKSKLPEIAGNERQASVGDVQFSLRKTHTMRFWTFKESDAERLAEVMGWRLKKSRIVLSPIAGDELAVSANRFQDIFIGNGSDMARELNALLPPFKGPEIEAQWNGFEFFKRLASKYVVWAIRHKDIRRLAEAWNWKLREDQTLEPLKDDEYPVSASRLPDHFVGMGSTLVVAIRSKLPPVTGPEMAVEVSGVRFQKRFTGSQIPIWSFHSTDAARVAHMMGWTLRTPIEETIEKLGLEEAISLLGNDPLRLKVYIQLYHPDLAPEEVDAIAIVGAMRGLRADPEDKEELHKGYEVTMPAPAIEVLNLPNLSTSGHAFKLQGETEPGVRYIQVVGAYTRKIRVRLDGSFAATLPVPRTAEPNPYFFYPVKDDTKERGEMTELTILQTGTKEDTEAAFLRLLALKEEVLESIKINPARYYFLLNSLEQSLLRHFTYGEDQGFAYLAERIRQEQSKALKEMLRAVAMEFKQIAGMPLNIRPDQRLYFFQKYTAYKTHYLLTEPDPVTGQVAQGVIIANEQGLGKTVTALVIVNGKEAVIITPNSVVSTWAEQEEKFMPQARMEILEGSYAERQAALQALTRPQVATNVEFTQGMTEERAAALSNKAEILVVDEADYLGRLASQQSKGTRMIKSVFRLLLTATPFKKISHIGNLLGFLYPNDPRFGSTKAFARAFPADDPESLNALFLLMQRHTIRVRKKDVFEEYDPAKPLSQQSDRLPRKVEVDPAQMGRFSLLKEQCDSIRQLFTDYQAWCQAHRVWVEQAGATPEDKKYKRFKEGFFPKLQALRQIMNDPSYFGQPELESPKHLEMDRIVHHELDGKQNADHKVIIFCKYVAEVEAYLKRFESYGAIGYYGDLPRDSNGYKIDAGKNREYYEVDEYENVVLKDGKPVAASKATGRPIRVLDYQRLLFQNDPKSRILVSTYETGSVGVTLTGAHAVIDDDLAPTYRDQYQADDRAHRIDNDRKKYEVRYYRLQAIYPKDWLDSLDPDDLHDYFEMGTYDQVQYDNLRIQARIFHRVMDGVGNESELVGIRHRFLANRMPFLFKGTDAQDTEEATAPEIIEGQDAGVEAESAGEVDDESGSQGLLAIWKPLIPWLQERGWSDTRIAGVLGGSEEFLFSGVLVSLGSLLLTHVFGISLTHALEITSFISGILFPLSHWKERYRLVGGQLTLAPPNEKKKDLSVLVVLGAVLRLACALPLARLPFGDWNILIALPLAFLGHGVYNAWIAPRLGTALGMAHKRLNLPQIDDSEEIRVGRHGLESVFTGSLDDHVKILLSEIEANASGPTSVVGSLTFQQRLNGRRVVWAFRRDDATRVAAHFGLTLRPSDMPEEIKPNEIAMTRPSMTPIYLATDMDVTLRQMRQAIMDAGPSGHSVIVDGIPFAQRMKNNRAVWAFDASQTAAVAGAFGLRMRSTLGAEAIREDEIRVAPQELVKYFIGAPHNLSAALIPEIERANPTANDLTLKGIHFVKRSFMGQVFWVFNQAQLPQLAAAFNLPLRPSEKLEAVTEGEVTLALAQLQPFFASRSAGLQKLILQEIAQLNPAGNEVDVRGIHFARRRSGFHTLWTFREDAVSDLAKAFIAKPKVKERLQAIKPDETSVSRPGLESFVLIIERTKLREVQDIIENASAGTNEVTIAGIDFVRRQNAANVVWTFQTQHRSAVAKHFGFELRPEGGVQHLAPGRITLTIRSLEPFLGPKTAEFLAAFNQALSPLEPQIHETDLHGVNLIRVLHGPHYVWSIDRNDLPRIVAALGFMLRSPGDLEPIQPGEISLGRPSLEKIYVGDHILARFLKQIRPQIEQAAQGRGAATIRGIPFIQRISSTRFVWTFREEDAAQVASEFGFRLRSNLPSEQTHDDEIAVTRPSLGRYVQIGHQKLKEIQEEIDALSDGLASFVMGDLPLIQRLQVNKSAWAFKEDDLDKFAARFNLIRRTNPNQLIEDLGLEDAIALLSDDPLRLKQYIQLYHPELDPEDVDAIAVAGSMRGLRADPEDKEELHKGYRVTLPAPAVQVLDLPDLSTSGHAFKLQGKTEPGVRYIQVIGAYTRKIRVRLDGSFAATLPVPRTAEPNQYFFYPVKDDTKVRGEMTELTILQTGTKEDTEAAFLRLLALKEEVLESIKINPARYFFLLHSLEQSLLRYFTYSEEQGFDYMGERIRQERSKTLREMLRAVESEFREIAQMRLDIKSGQHLYFFQKYTVYKVHHLLTEPDPVTREVAQGVIIANEQGLGKTVTALVIVNGKEAVIITPNSVVSTWGEQEEKFMPEPKIEILEGTYAERQKALKSLKRPQVVTNVEFTQGMTKERAEALSRKATLLVVDEADYLGRLASQQSKGTRMIKATFRLLLTATPFKKVSHIGNLLGFLYPNDARFQSTRAFARAFPADNPETLNALFLLMQRHTIRVRKKDVFEEYNPAIALDQQSDRLPKKVEVDPAKMGRFSLLAEQCESIAQLFTDYQAWCRAHKDWIDRQGIASQEDRKYTRFKEGYFPKLQALRQIMNDPAYFGRPELESPKHREMDKIVHHELDGPANADHKVIIFCKYVAEVEGYLERYQGYGAIGYYGELPKDSNGYKVDAGKSREYYEVDEYENFVLRGGRPIKTTKDKGRPIRALDYQRLLFQNDPNSRILLATYETGSVGVTLTGAHAVIDDDLAPTYRDQYQSDDRAHRIDNDRKKYEVRYYRLQATYPKPWLDSLDPDDLHDYFEMGTYDQVQYDNLRIQARIFHRVLDGVGDESELVGIRRRFLANRMPFLFSGSDAQDTEEATAPEIMEGRDAGVEAESAGEVDDEGGSQGLLSIWKPLIPWLQERGWSDTRIAGVLGGSEEFLFSGVLVSLGSLLLTHASGITLAHALEITSFISGILFPLSHWKERHRLVGGQLTLAPPNEKKKDLITLSILGTVLRLAYALPLAGLPFGHWNILIAMPLVFLGHAAYNVWIAPRLGVALGVALHRVRSRQFLLPSA